MKNFPLIVTIVSVLIIFAGVVFFSISKSKRQKSYPLPIGYEYFWGIGCPHCENVANFMESWDKKDKVTIEKMEVNENSDNAQRLLERGKYCLIDQNSIGAVPLLFTQEGKCYLGDEPIIDFLKEIKP